MVRRAGPAVNRAGRRGIAATVGAAVAVSVLALLIAQPSPLASNLGRWRSIAFVGAAWVTFGVAALLVRRAPPRAAVVLILLGGLGLPLAAAFGPPRSSDDVYRYIWDGRVQAEGINPYRHVPAAADLASLRDGTLWPSRSHWCVEPGATDVYRGDALAPGCTLINRPTVPTIYPPVAQAVFRLVVAVSRSSGYAPMQLAASALAFATTVALLAALRRRGADPRWAALWAWCPAVAYEAGSNAHIDVLAALLTVLALIVLSGRRDRRGAVGGGALLGLAIATKLTPALVLPAVIRRRPVAVVGAVVGAVAVVYLPHVLAVGADVVGFIPGYLAEEGYADGSRFALVSWLLPDPWRTAAVAVVLGATAVRSARVAAPDRPWVAAATVVGTALLAAAPSYPWYALLLVALVGLGARAEWLVVAAAGYLAQYAGDAGLAIVTAQRIGYGAALVAVVAGGLLRQPGTGQWRRRRRWRPSSLWRLRRVEPRFGQVEVDDVVH